jgi:Holliday junction resolvasome RuvABC ATP-dependent DNA helicase subunit
MKLDFYSEDDISKIINRSSEVLELELPEDTIFAIAKKSR